MTIARCDAEGAVVDAVGPSAHRMLVVDGKDDDGTELDSCQLYDAVCDRWSVQEARLPQSIRCQARCADRPEGVQCSLPSAVG